MAASAALTIPVAVYLYHLIKRAARVFGVYKDSRGQKWIAAVTAAVVVLPAANIWGLWAVVVWHFTAVSLIVELVRFIFLKRLKKESRIWNAIYGASIIPAAVTLAILGYGYLNMRYVIQTDYTVETDKEIREEGYQIAFLSDLHYGTTMNRKQLEKYCAKIEENEPDALILGGDIVDERTTLDQVREAFSVLGQTKTSFGVYYVCGNHDKGRYFANCDFTPEELFDAAGEGGVVVLEDETYLLGDELTLTGRRDRSDAAMSKAARRPSSALLENTDRDGFHILADHQPREFEENEKAGYDLMLSGHTHAGQIWPVGLITSLFDKGTINYGQRQVGNLDVIVSSGMAGWGYPVRTGKHCEYVVVHIRK